MIEFTAGLVVILIGAEALVRGAVGMARRFGWSPLVAGLIIVALGTSAPELAVGLVGTVSGHIPAALGNAVGSNLFNLLFILGLTALIRPIAVQGMIVKRDIPLLLVSGLAVWLAVLNGYLGRLEGVIMVAAAMAYVIVSLRRSETPVEDLAEPGQGNGRQLVISLALAVAGAALLALGAYWMTDAAPTVGALLGLNEFVVGLLMMSVGTSLPEIAAVFASVRQRQADLAVGNIVGSCIFNLLAVLGVIAVTASHSVVAPHEIIFRELPLMILATLLCLPLAISGKRFSRWEGGLLLAAYAAYALIVLMGLGASDTTARGRDDNSRVGHTACIAIEAPQPASDESHPGSRI